MPQVRKRGRKRESAMYQTLNDDPLASEDENKRKARMRKKSNKKRKSPHKSFSKVNFVSGCFARVTFVAVKCRCLSGLSLVTKSNVTCTHTSTHTQGRISGET